MLEMKSECLACGGKLDNTSEAMICSYECSYCVPCATKQNKICKNCNGELKPRPKRAAVQQS